MVISLPFTALQLTPPLTRLLLLLLLVYPIRFHPGEWSVSVPIVPLQTSTGSLSAAVPPLLPWLFPNTNWAKHRLRPDIIHHRNTYLTGTPSTSIICSNTKGAEEEESSFGPCKSWSAELYLCLWNHFSVAMGKLSFSQWYKCIASISSCSSSFAVVLYGE